MRTRRKRRRKRAQVKSKCTDKKIPGYVLSRDGHIVNGLFSREEMDDEDCERRRVECLDEMLDLEKQFQELKEK